MVFRIELCDVNSLFEVSGGSWLTENARTLFGADLSRWKIPARHQSARIVVAFANADLPLDL